MNAQHSQFCIAPSKYATSSIKSDTTINNFKIVSWNTCKKNVKAIPDIIKTMRYKMNSEHIIFLFQESLKESMARKILEKAAKNKSPYKIMNDNKFIMDLRR